MIPLSESGPTDVAVLAVNWNGRRDCEPMMKSIRDQTLGPVEVVVVDNGSTDGSQEWFRSQSDVRVIANAENRGFAAAVNQGIRATGATYLLLCNLDVVLDPGFLEAAVARATISVEIGSVGGRLRTGPEDQARLDTTGHLLYRSGWVVNRDQGAPDDGRRRLAQEVFGVSAAAALYRRRMLEDVALNGEVLCEDFFAYLEDVDLDWRARWRGWQSWYEPAATARHRRGGTGLHRTAAIERHVVSNRISVWVRNAPPRWLKGAPLASAATLFALRTGRAALRHPEAASGAADAIRRLPLSRRERRLIMAGRRADPDQVSNWARPTPWTRLLRGGSPGSR
ncbi:MAG TPA: glycosyltransferase family 2 protein [Candidatus Dormibacteraeota bacterium]|nr:glycosyltransferase family 2 protein [Candidatus Dormibacteraeota bacterium]